ncbi:MAG: sigma-70 family RNA polymerase sigma factor [Lewinellaceae bacterium]|nr:sigma-70 family RNA polymerase sigma factor [Lewinellaceae bacterium]
MDKNFGLSPNDFDRLVHDLKKNEADFFKTVFLKHFKECMIFLQRQNSASMDDAYDATMDALIQFRRLLVEGKLRYGNLRYLFTKMASQIYLKNKKKFQIQEIGASDMEMAEPGADGDQENIALLNAAWGQLGPDCQELLKLHYYGQMKLTEIATYKEKTPAAVRKQKERCIERIRSTLQKEKLTQ